VKSAGEGEFFFIGAIKFLIVSYEKENSDIIVFWL